MFEWIPQAARELKGRITDLYWVLLVIVFLFVILFQFVGVAEGRIDARKTLIRVIVSTSSVMVFRRIANIVSIVTAAWRTNSVGIENLKALFSEIEKRYIEKSPSLFSFGRC